MNNEKSTPVQNAAQNLSPEPQGRTSAHRLRRTLGALACGMVTALVWLAPPCRAQDPSPTPTCSPTPPIPSPTPGNPYNRVCSQCFSEGADFLLPTSHVAKDIPAAFQPPDGTILQWVEYIPAGSGPFYTILVFHGGGFYKGTANEIGVQKLAADLQANGYYVLAVSYRLAPCGLIKKQPNHSHPESGRPPEQTDDAKSLVRAARQQPLCNGHVAVLGGGAGAAHAVFAALDMTPSPPSAYPNWCQGGVDDRPDCAIALSGPYDLSDREDAGGVRLEFVKDVENYTNTITRVDPDGGPSQKTVSVVAQVKPQSVQTFKPLFAAGSVNDETPPHQMDDLECALLANNIDSSLYETLVIPGSDHGLLIWFDKDGLIPSRRLRLDAFDFLNAHFKSQP